MSLRKTGENESVRGQKRRSVSLRKTMVKFNLYVVKIGRSVSLRKTMVKFKLYVVKKGVSWH